MILRLVLYDGSRQGNSSGHSRFAPEPRLWSERQSMPTSPASSPQCRQMRSLSSAMPMSRASAYVCALCCRPPVFHFFRREFQKLDFIDLQRLGLRFRLMTFPCELVCAALPSTLTAENTGAPALSSCEPGQYAFCLSTGDVSRKEMSVDFRFEVEARSGSRRSVATYSFIACLQLVYALGGASVTEL